MKQKDPIYNDDFIITIDEFLGRLEAFEKNKQLQKSLLNKNNILNFPKHVSFQKMEARM